MPLPCPRKIAAVYPAVKNAIIEHATAADGDLAATDENKSKFKRQLAKVCREAVLDPHMRAECLWWHLWTKPRYANYRSERANRDIQAIPLELISDWNRFCKRGWDLQRTKYTTTKGRERSKFMAVPGTDAYRFWKTQPPYDDFRFNRALPRLKRIIDTAKWFAPFARTSAPLVAILDGRDPAIDQHLRSIHADFARVLGPVTALHFMMDIGFPVVKPDIWLTRMLSCLGWLDLASDIDIESAYSRPEVYWHAIAVARAAAHHIEPEPNCPNRLREFDLVIAKYGMRPEIDWGIVRSLHRDWKRIQDLAAEVCCDTG